MFNELTISLFVQDGKYCAGVFINGFAASNVYDQETPKDAITKAFHTLPENFLTDETIEDGVYEATFSLENVDTSSVNEELINQIMPNEEETDKN